MITGLEDISDGENCISSRVVNDLTLRERNISVVFRNYALCPDMTVRENLGFTLQIANRLEAAAILWLAEMIDGKPAELSGGQCQRVANTIVYVTHDQVEEMTLADRIVLKDALTVPASTRDLVKAGHVVQSGYRADNLMQVDHEVEEKGALVDPELPVALEEPLGTETLLLADLAEVEVQANLFKPRPMYPGETLPFHLVLCKCHVIDAGTSEALRG
jgi:multiple sugar transport system ATP-binding protein